MMMVVEVVEVMDFDIDIVGRICIVARESI
jgi:hypothetical protein